VLDRFDRLLGRLAGLFAVLGGVAALGLVAITITAVVSRYLFNDPIFGIEDLSVLTLTVVAAASVAYGARHGSHVSVNVISLAFGRSVTRYTDLAMRGLVVGITALAVYALITKACGIEKACITGNMSVEHRPFYYVLAAALALYSAQVAVQLVIGLVHFGGTDPNEPHD